MNERKKKYLGLALVLAIAAVVALAGSPGQWLAQPLGHAQSDQQPASGPQPDVGETVLVPKKTQPAPSQPSQPSYPVPTVQPEKKPEKINPNEIYTLTTSTNLVNVDVMVVDNNGNPVQNLGKKNFQLFDDGVPQAVTNFGTGEAPMTICMLIEYANRWWPYLILALQDSYQFLGVIQPKDWIAVVSFDMHTQILTDFTQDRSEVRGALDTIALPRFQRIQPV